MTSQLPRTGNRRANARILAAVLSLLLIPADTLLLAQQATPAPAPSAAPAAEPEAVKLSADQLCALVAPIALYPDPLLAQVLVASTYPLDIVLAQQWLAQNDKLKGDALSKAAERQPWDPSVQALVLLPDALKLLSENISWTKDLGDAFLAQQEDVMTAVQDLRRRAKDDGKLETTEQQTVQSQTEGGETIVVIQPSNPEVVYVPSYNPTVIWGAPYYPYPPIYYPPPYYGGAWLGFGVGVAIGIGISGGWGWGCGWGHNDININYNNNFVNNSNRNNNINRSGNGNWQHNAQQRGGVPYRDKATANKYGGGTRGASASNRAAAVALAAPGWPAGAAAPVAPAAKQTTFDSPRQAADAAIAAAAAEDLPALLAMIGPDGKDLVDSGDPVADREIRARFVEKARQRTEVEFDLGNPKVAKILARRIGENELDAIEILRGYVEAQFEYASEYHDGSNILQYAQKSISTPGKRDGLAWREADGSVGGPIGEFIARALSEGHASQTEPYNGYYFRILKGQGPAAPLGARNYVVNGAMIGGFAMIAWPSNYGVTGIQTFQVNHDGLVHQKDLGPETAKIAAAMTVYDPGQGWVVTLDGE